VVTLGVERFFFKQPVAPAALLCVMVIFAGAALIAVPGLRNGTIDPRGLAWAVPGPVVYAFYLAANARLTGRHPPLIGAGFLYGGLAAAYLGAVLAFGASLPTSAPGWLSLAFLALGPGAVAAVSQSYSMPRLGPTTYAMKLRLPIEFHTYSLRNRKRKNPIMRSSFSTSARGSSANRSINVKTVEELSPGGAASIRPIGVSLCSVAAARVTCFLIRFPPIRSALSIAPRFEAAATVGVLGAGPYSALASDRCALLKWA
jgi:hypothetical protein